MTSLGLNKWTVSGNLAADVEIKTVELRNGEQAQVAKGTLYVRKARNRDESFTVSLNIWEKSYAWRTLPFLKKGSVVICTGMVEPNPYISKNGNVPKAGLEMTVLDVDLDIVRDADTEAEPSQDDKNSNEPNPPASSDAKSIKSPENKSPEKATATATPPTASPSANSDSKATKSPENKSPENKSQGKATASDTKSGKSPEKAATAV